MGLQRKTSQHGPSSLFSPILASSGGETSNKLQQNGPGVSSSYNQNVQSSYSQSSSSSSFFHDQPSFTVSHHHNNNNQQQQMPSRQQQQNNFIPVNRFGSPPTGVLTQNFSQLTLHANHVRKHTVFIY